MVIRELAADEFHRLDGHPSGHPIPSPETSRVVVAEVDDRIIAFWPLTQIVVGDGVWIDPDYRSGLVAGRMWAEIRQILDECRVPVLHSFAATPEVAGYLERLGFTLLPYVVLSCPLPLPQRGSLPVPDSSATG